MNGKYYWFAYPTKTKEFREQRHASHVDVHRLRDAAMILTLGMACQRKGLGFGGIITNIPNDYFNPAQEEIYRRYPTFTSADVVVLPTRPPVTYSPSDRIPSITPSGSDLEVRAITASATFFRRLSRRELELSPTVAKQCGKYADVQFKLYGGADIDATEERDHSLAFLYTVPRAFESGARLLAGFGMGGHETFVWAQVLREQDGLLERLLSDDRPHFLMARIQTPKCIPYPYVEYEDIRYAVIADVTI